MGQSLEPLFCLRPHTDETNDRFRARAAETLLAAVHRTTGTTRAADGADDEVQDSA
jgi:hypothetical protein